MYSSIQTSKCVYNYTTCNSHFNNESTCVHIIIVYVANLPKDHPSGGSTFNTYSPYTDNEKISSTHAIV